MKNRVVKNIGWIMGGKIVQSVIALIIGMITARYLGPSNYGIISYVSSVVSFALPIMQLGLTNTLVKEFIKKPKQEGKILGTALVINTLSSIFCMIGCVTFVMVANPNDRVTMVVCALYSLKLLFQATEMTQYWFQAKLLSKYPSIAMLISYVVTSAYKIYLLVTQKSLEWFAFTHAIECFLISVLLIAIYKKLGGQRLSVDWKTGKDMLGVSVHYIIPSLMVTIFHHTDQVMIKMMKGETETGLYAAALTAIGITAFVFVAVIDSARPIILAAKEKNPAIYEKRMIQLYSVITYMSLAQSIGMTLLAKPLIIVMFGDEYIASAGILAVAVWYVTFGHYGSVRNIWILAEGKQKHLTKINVVGAVTNVLLNVCLISVWGAIGAAIASIITQFFTNVVIGFIFKPIRHNNYFIIKSLNPKIMIELLSELLQKL